MFWSKQTHISSQLRRQGRHLLLRSVQLSTQLSDLLVGEESARVTLSKMCMKNIKNSQKIKEALNLQLPCWWLWWKKTVAVTWLLCVKRHWNEVWTQVWGITVEFWTVWPLIEKRRVNINTMLHFSTQQPVVVWLERKRLSQATALVSPWLDFKQQCKEMWVSTPDLGQRIFAITWCDFKDMHLWV